MADYSRLELLTKSSKDLAHSVMESGKIALLYVFAQPYCMNRVEGKKTVDWPVDIMFSAAVSAIFGGAYLLATNSEPNLSGGNTTIDYVVASIPAVTNTSL